MFLCDLFFIKNIIKFASYPDGNTLLFVGKDIVYTISKLNNTSASFFQWLEVVYEEVTWTTRVVYK